MVKQILSILIVIAILLVGGIAEHNFVFKQFKELDVALTVLYDKIEEQSATEQDVEEIKEDWLKKKRYLHIFIPHNEIKEIDLWLFESITLVRDEKWEDASSKIKVLLGLVKEIPKTFNISLENIM